MFNALNREARKEREEALLKNLAVFAVKNFTAIESNHA
jgi:hypothetical protein